MRLDGCGVLVVAYPAMSVLILTVIGTPASNPASSLLAMQRSIAAASVMAASWRASTTAFNAVFTASIRVNALRVASTALTRRSRMAVARSVAVICHGSFIRVG